MKYSKWYYIPVSQNRKTKVSEEDYHIQKKYKWCTDGDGYARRKSHKAENRDKNFVSLHRDIMGNPEGLCVDHINGDLLDNRRENLRLATKQQNSRNSTYTTPNSTSKYRGVGFNKQRNKWRARIRVKRKTVFCKFFDNEKDAAKAYLEKAKELFGEFHPRMKI